MSVARPYVARDIEVRGVVQGVGFRPFICRLADRFGLSGWVRNDDGLVRIHAEGSDIAIEGFCHAIRSEAPPHAVVDQVECTASALQGLTGFEVDERVLAPPEERLLSPDVATCEACVRELSDPEDRRFRYAFTDCRECGPRFATLEALPYERENTSMRAFPMCEECAREYADPGNRRFQHVSVSCPACGPRLSILDARRRRLRADPIERSVELLRKGKIVAIQGLGGFDLACDATDQAAVERLRTRLSQPTRPLPVMIPDVTGAYDWFELGPSEGDVLASWRAPAVLVPHLGKLAPSVAPGHRTIGVMLPSTPAHHLVLSGVDVPLVMVEGRAAGGSACRGPEDALEALGAFADAYLVHDGTIVEPYEVSVVHMWRGAIRVHRRARGFAPAPMPLPAEVEPVLGCGGRRDVAFCLAMGDRAFLSQPVSDLDTEAAMDAYRRLLDRNRALFAIEPTAVAHDLDPGFATTRFAGRTGLPAVPVQHHHAHVVAVMAEHRLEGQVIGVAFDRAGMGDDGTSWGGEFLVCDWERSRRAARLRPIALPGADDLDPLRTALAFASDADVLRQALPLLAGGGPDSGEVREDPDEALEEMASASVQVASSAGRLLEAVAALTGVCLTESYAGEAAELLEQAAHHDATHEYEFDVGLVEGLLELDTRPIVASVVRDMRKGRRREDIAGRVHRTLAAAIVDVCRILRGSTGLQRICLGGGVFQNDFLTSDVASRLTTMDFEVFLPREAPVGDGGIALGQVLVAHARRAHR